MKESASSPLELYEKAYILQYDEGKTSEACRLYKAIIDEFPESNECGYSVIQLEKILAKNVSDRIVVSSKMPMVLSIIAVAVAICCLVSALIVGSIYVKTVNTQMGTLSLVNQALGKLATGKDKEAVLILDNAKISSQSKDPAPYLLAADVYIKRQQYVRAMAELDTARKLSGGETFVKEDLLNSKAESEEAATLHKAPQEPAPVADSASQPKAIQEIESPKQEAVVPPQVKEPKQVKPKKEPTTPSRSVKQKKQSNKDSVSFF